MAASSGKLKPPIGPRSWLTWLYIGIFYVIAQFPLGTLYQIGHGIGRLVQRLVKSRAKVVSLNLKLCFPDLTTEERESLSKKTFESLGVMALEVFSLYFGRYQEIVERGRLWHVDQLTEAIDEGNGVILLGIHLNSMDAAAAIIKENGFQFSCVMRKQKNVVANYLSESRRKSIFGSENVFDMKNLRDAVLRLRVKEKPINLWLAADQDMGRRQRGTVFAPFFGVEASTVTAIPRIMGFFKDSPPPALVLMSQYRDEKNRRINVKFSRVKDLPSGDLREAATFLNEKIEAAIRECPEQYYWVHRRFKTLPDGGTRDYHA